MTTKTIIIDRGIGLGITVAGELMMIMGVAWLVGIAPMPTLPSAAMDPTTGGLFPIIGWGFLGLQIGPALTVGSLVLHILFAVLLCYYGRRLVRGDYDLS